MFTQNDFTQSTLPKQSNAKQYVLYTFIFLIVLALGVLIGLEIPVIRHRTYNDGWNAAKARLAESEQFGFLEAERETKILDGIVVEIMVIKSQLKQNLSHHLLIQNLRLDLSVFSKQQKSRRLFHEIPQHTKKNLKHI